MAHHDVAVLFREVSDYYFSTLQNGQQFVHCFLNNIKYYQNISNLFPIILMPPGNAP